MSQTQGLVESARIERWRLQSESYAGGHLCETNDLVLNRLKAHLGVFAYAPKSGVVSADYSVFRPKPDVDVRYLEYLLKIPPYVGELRRNTKGIVEGFWRLYSDDFFQIRIPLPPCFEQRGIVRFLDHHDRLTRRYIRAKRRQIALLTEQKQAIIQQAVTRGLDPDVPLKPSGVEWLGDVPAQWQLTRLKYVAEIQTGITLGKNYGSTPLETRPYLRVANVQVGYLNLTNVATLQVPAPEAAKTELRTGDVLMTEGGDIDKLGRGCIWRGEIPDCIHQNHIFAVRANRAQLDPDYLVALMSSAHGRNYFQITAKKTTNLASTNSTTLGDFPLFLPTLTEQREILDAVAKSTGAIDEAASRSQREIDLIREYRTRLIADVVTGKLDVRGVELPALDEGDEAEAWVEEASEEEGAMGDEESGDAE